MNIIDVKSCAINWEDAEFRSRGTEVAAATKQVQPRVVVDTFTVVNEQNESANVDAAAAMNQKKLAVSVVASSAALVVSEFRSSFERQH